MKQAETFKTFGPKEVQTLSLASAEVARRAGAVQSTLKKIELDSSAAKELEGWSLDVAKRLEAAGSDGVDLNEKHRQVLILGLTILLKTEEGVKEKQEGLLAEVTDVDDHIAFLEQLQRRLKQVDAPELPLEQKEGGIPTPPPARGRRKKTDEETPVEITGDVTVVGAAGGLQLVEG
jgi:hypothetical protein